VEMKVGDLVVWNRRFHDDSIRAVPGATGLVLKVFTEHPTIPANTTIEVMWSGGAIRHLGGDVKVVSESR